MKLDSLKIKTQREQKALTQEALAGKARLSVRTIQRAESGEKISKQNILEIAQALGIDHHLLFEKKTIHHTPRLNVLDILQEQPHDFFSSRFSKAFPGQRDIRTFEDVLEIKRRLLQLLEPPIVFHNEKPIWYWFDGEADIFRFEEQCRSLFLMNYYELNIRKISSAYSSNPKCKFIYVESDGLHRTGLHDAFCGGFESYGVYKGRNISHAEYIDGAAEINGEIIDFDGTEEFRERPLEPFNFLIGPRTSVINCRGFEEHLMELLKGMLEGSITIHELARVINNLPNNSV